MSRFIPTGVLRVGELTAPEFAYDSSPHYPTAESMRESSIEQLCGVHLSVLMDTLCLRVLGWRHTKVCMCTDDMRPMEDVGVFHPPGTHFYGDSPRYYAEPDCSRDALAAMEWVLASPMLSPNGLGWRDSLWSKYAIALWDVIQERAKERYKDRDISDDGFYRYREFVSRWSGDADLEALPALFSLLAIVAEPKHRVVAALYVLDKEGIVAIDGRVEYV